MHNLNLKNISFIEFLKLRYIEVKQHEQTNLTDYIDAIMGSVVQFPIQKKWIHIFNLLKQSMIGLYFGVDCSWQGKNPNAIDIFKNYGTTLIEFSFDKCHVLVTQDSFFFLPYSSSNPKSKVQFFDFLQEPFRIIYNIKNQKNKYANIRTIFKLVSIDAQHKKTNLVFKSSRSSKEVLLILNQDIKVDN